MAKKPPKVTVLPMADKDHQVPFIDLHFRVPVDQPGMGFSDDGNFINLGFRPIFGTFGKRRAMIKMGKVMIFAKDQEAPAKQTKAPDTAMRLALLKAIGA